MGWYRAKGNYFMIKIAIRFWPTGEQGEPRAFDLFALSRVPSVGEHVAHVHDETSDNGIYRVVRVLHLLKRGDEGRAAEVDAVLDRAHGF